MNKHIAIIGAGPAGLFLLKHLLKSKCLLTISVFEAKGRAGKGMPYSRDGAGPEHITNVSGNEIPDLPQPLVDWLKAQPLAYLRLFNLDRDGFNDYKVLPRLVFGDYLAAQFDAIVTEGLGRGHTINLYFNTPVTDIKDEPTKRTVTIYCHAQCFNVDHAVICTGHVWPREQEGKIKGYYDSPYPASKLQDLRNHPVAIRGSSLTAIDAVRTLARVHGRFIREGKHKMSYYPDKTANHFKMIMHSRNGLLPAVRFHLEDPRLSKTHLATKEELEQHRKENDGFISLDFLFERNFKKMLQEKEPAFYDDIKKMNLETFVETMMGLRDPAHPFEFFKKEYAEAADSIRRSDSIYWKEMLAILSFALNYPAKYLSAEDMQRLRKTLMPLIAIVIAFVPQSSCEELIALYEAGALDIVAIGDESIIEPHPEEGIVYHIRHENGQMKTVHYKTFIDAIGQRHLEMEDFPFASLVKDGTVSVAKLKFREAGEGKKQYTQQAQAIGKENDDFYLLVPGLAIGDDFNAIDMNGKENPRVYIMAVPYIGGFNPDYSGLDFCEEAAGRISAHILAGC